MPCCGGAVPDENLNSSGTILLDCYKSAFLVIDRTLRLPAGGAKPSSRQKGGCGFAPHISRSHRSHGEPAGGGVVGADDHRFAELDGGRAALYDFEARRLLRALGVGLPTRSGVPPGAAWASTRRLRVKSDSNSRPGNRPLRGIREVDDPVFEPSEVVGV
jgi:hypothetical protein